MNLKRLKAERVAKGLTQEEMAKKMGWSTRYPYTKRENGYVPITADELIRMILILGYSINDIGLFFNQNVLNKERNVKLIEGR